MNELKNFHNKRTSKVISKEFLNKKCSDKVIDKKTYINIFNKKSYLISKNKIKRKSIKHSSNYYIQKNTNNIKSSIFCFQNKILFLFWAFILIDATNSIISQKIKTKNVNRILQYSNVVTLTLIGNEYQKIIDSSYCPDKIYLNYIEITLEKGYIFINNSNLEENIITMIWNQKLDSFQNLFLDSSAIEIDLSEFDTSEITTMESMFENCYYLQFINFGNNFNTSKVKSMD